MYARTDAEDVKGPIDDRSVLRLKELVAADPQAFVVTQWPGRESTPTARHVARTFGIHLDSELEPNTPPWIEAAGLRVVHSYALPNGRRYALLRRTG
jgi:hypothetical protein